MDHELRVANERLTHLLRLLGAATFDDAAEALATLRARIHDLSNDVYGQRLLLNELQRQLGCEEYIEILPALARKVAQIDNLEMALERALNQGCLLMSPVPNMVSFRDLEPMEGRN